MSATLLGVLKTDVRHSCALAIKFTVQCESSGSKLVITLKWDKYFDIGQGAGKAHTRTGEERGEKVS